MNQILLTENESKKKKSNKYSNNSNNDMKKIIMFFGIVILVFGVAIAGVYGYKSLNKSGKKENVESEPPLAIEETEEEVTITANSEFGINKIIYTWNDEEPNEIELNGGKSYEERIDIPNGENTLNVKVIYQNGQEEETSQSFLRDGDAEKPVIETAIVENAKLKITATDETAMKYISYRWNDEEDVKIDVENEEDKVLEITLDVKRGKNTLAITAVDSSDNSETIDKTFNGVNNPVIEVTKRDTKLYMKMTHDMGFEKIDFDINGNKYTYDKNFAGYDATQKELEYYFDLINGENIVIITAISTEGTEATYKGKCNYTAE